MHKGSSYCSIRRPADYFQRLRQLIVIHRESTRLACGTTYVDALEGPIMEPKMHQIYLNLLGRGVNVGLLTIVVMGRALALTVL